MRQFTLVVIVDKPEDFKKHATFYYTPKEGDGILLTGESTGDIIIDWSKNEGVEEVDVSPSILKPYAEKYPGKVIKGYIFP